MTDAILGQVLAGTCAFLLDLVWAGYSIAMAERKPVRAGTFSALIFLMGGVLAVGYIQHPELLFGCCVGAFLGTYVGVRKL